MAEPLQFQPLAGGLDVGFLAELGHRKLNEFGLRDDAVEIRGSFSCAGQHNVRSHPSRAHPSGPALLTRPALLRHTQLASPLCVSADGFAALDAPGVPPTH